MKGLFKLTSAALAVAALASCTSDDLLDINGNGVKVGKNTITATLEDVAETRVGVATTDAGDTKAPRGLVFSEGDVLNVYTTQSTEFDTYELADGANTDKANFQLKGTGKLDLTDGSDYYGVILNAWSEDADIYGVSATAGGKALLTMNIPEAYKYVYPAKDASWKDQTGGEAYRLPLPVWGKVTVGADKELAVDLSYMTGIMKLNVTNLRAQTKYVQLVSTPDAPLSGYFNTELEVGCELKKAKGILVSGSTLTVELPEHLDYEGLSDYIYIPVIAQTYPSLTIQTLDENGDLQEVLETFTNAKVTRDQIINVTRSMTVLSGATFGCGGSDRTNDISSKLYELTSKNEGLPVKMELLEQVEPNQTIIIDESAVNSLITLVFDKPIPAGLQIVSGNMKSVDENTGFVTWKSEKATKESVAREKKNSVKIVYNNQVANTEGFDVYLPYSAVTLASAAMGGTLNNKDYDNTNKAGFNIVTAKGEKSLVIDKTAQISNGNYVVMQDGGDIEVNGYVRCLKQLSQDGNVTVNDLNRTMQNVEMGDKDNTVKGKLVIEGESTALNNGKVVNIKSYSTGGFAAKNIDKFEATTEWNFFRSSVEGITIENDRAITGVPSLNVEAQNNITLDNTVVTTLTYDNKKVNLPATITAKNRSAIGKIVGDGNDNLTITSKWNGKSVTSNETGNTKKYNGRDITKGDVLTVRDLVYYEVHTAYQLASLSTNEVVLELKAKTVIDMSGTEWKNGVAHTAGLAVNGDMNSVGKSATIKGLNCTESGRGNGLFLSTNGYLDIQNLNIEGINFTNAATSGALIGSVNNASGTIKNVKVSDVTISAKTGSVIPVGGLIGTATVAQNQTLELITTTVDVDALTGYVIGGMIGQTKGEGTVKFGSNDGKPADKISKATAVSVTSYNVHSATLDNKYVYGSVNAYVGNVESGTIEINPYCKHGNVPASVDKKTGLGFKKNVLFRDASNTADQYFWGGNPWVGTVAQLSSYNPNQPNEDILPKSTATVKFPDVENNLTLAENGKDYNVRKTSVLYNEATYTDVQW